MERRNAVRKERAESVDRSASIGVVTPRFAVAQVSAYSLLF